MKTESPFQPLDDSELVNIRGGMYQAFKWATKSTRMGDGTVEGQQWYQDRQAAEARARTAEILRGLKTSDPAGYNQLMHPSPFQQAPSAPFFTYKPNPYPGHPECRAGK